MITLQQSAAVTNTALQDFFTKKLASAKAIHPNYARLLTEMQRISTSGKRIRPHLVFTGYGSYDEAIVPIAVAHELLHIAILAHDDIIDRDLIRHDQPTIEHAYATQHYTFANNRHLSRSAALLAGDVLISSAYEHTLSSSLPPEQIIVAQQLLAKGIFEVVGGELLDTEAPFSPEPIDPMIVYRYKTAAYSFEAPLLTGVRLSPNTYDNDTVEAVRAFAENSGIAFQIRDDILGVFGNSATTGKSTETDLREGKKTLLIQEFQQRADQAQRTLFADTFGDKKATSTQLEKLKTALKDSGALSATEQQAEAYERSALHALDTLPETQLKADLNALTSLLQKRKA